MTKLLKMFEIFLIYVHFMVKIEHVNKRSWVLYTECMYTCVMN